MPGSDAVESVYEDYLESGDWDGILADFFNNPLFELDDGAVTKERVAKILTPKDPGVAITSVDRKEVSWPPGYHHEAANFDGNWYTEDKSFKLALASVDKTTLVRFESKTVHPVSVS